MYSILVLQKQDLKLRFSKSFELQNFILMNESNECKISATNFYCIWIQMNLRYPWLLLCYVTRALVMYVWNWIVFIHSYLISSLAREQIRGVYWKGLMDSAYCAQTAHGAFGACSRTWTSHWLIHNFHWVNLFILFMFSNISKPFYS